MSQLLSSLWSWDSSEKIPVISHEGSVFDVLQSEVLEQVYSTLVENRLHGVAIEFSENEEERVSDLSTFIFSPTVRMKNLWWHLDAFNRPESRAQILTALYSPPGSYSWVPTQTTLTEIVDQKTQELFQNSKYLRSYQDELRIYEETIESVLWSRDERAFYTLLQNCFLPHREINRKDNNRMVWLRDDLIRDMLLDPEVEKWVFYTRKDVSSLLLFRNGLWENRDIAHTRFHIWPESRESVGYVYNMSIHQGWILQPNSQPLQVVPEGVRYQYGGITNIKRDAIIPE